MLTLGIGALALGALVIVTAHTLTYGRRGRYWGQVSPPVGKAHVDAPRTKL